MIEDAAALDIFSFILKRIRDGKYRPPEAHLRLRNMLQERYYVSLLRRQIKNFRKLYIFLPRNLRSGMKKRLGRKGLGTVLHIMDKLLIVRGGRLPVEGMINALVMTEDKKKIGKVYDIFGPVDQPYVSIKILGDLKEEELKKLVHKKLYVL